MTIEDELKFQIDHVHIYVPSRYEAAKWYKKILSLEIIKEFEFWATESGPLMLSADEGNTKLALFRHASQNNQSGKNHGIVAFRIDGLGFLSFLKKLNTHTVFNESNGRISSRNVVDPGKAFSIYFTDPYGNRFEITTYDHEQISNEITV